MLYELESPPYAQKPATATTNKLKISSLSETNHTNNTNTNNISAPKPVLNGIGFTSNKVYGPELPPARLEKTENGNVSSTNGDSKLSSPSNSSESDSDIENVITVPSSKKTPLVKETDISSTSREIQTSISTSNYNKTHTPLSSPNISTSVSSLSSPDSTPKKEKDVPNANPQITKPLVPYESDDTSCSDDSNQSPNEIESRVSTEAAVGEWQVTSSTDINQEPSSEGGSWEKKKPSQSPSIQNAVSDLFKMSHSGYSTPVSSWNGSRSQLDKEINNERREDRKRALVDSSDQGKAKHPKLNSNYKSNPGYNPIQVGNYFFFCLNVLSSASLLLKEVNTLTVQRIFF